MPEDVGQTPSVVQKTIRKWSKYTYDEVYSNLKLETKRSEKQREGEISGWFRECRRHDPPKTARHLYYIEARLGETHDGIYYFRQLSLVPCRDWLVKTKMSQAAVAALGRERRTHIDVLAFISTSESRTSLQSPQRASSDANSCADPKQT